MSENNDASAAREKLRRGLAFDAAVLFLLGGLTGGYVAAAMTGKVQADPGSAVAAHMNALLGCFWLVGMAWSLKWSRLTQRGNLIMTTLAVTAAYSNWAITAVKAALMVRGVARIGEPVNDMVFYLLTVFVVLPSLGASVLWVWSLRSGGDGVAKA